MAVVFTPTGSSGGDRRGYREIGPSGRNVYHTNAWWNVLNNRVPGQPLGAFGTGGVAAPMDHPINQGGPIDRYSAASSDTDGPQSGGTGLAHAILLQASKTQPVNPHNRSSSGGLYGLLAAAAQRAMEQQAQMKGQYGADTQTRLHQLQQQSANLHAGR